MPAAKVLQVSVTREELPIAYRQLLLENPLLARIEGETRTLGWSDEEIRTLQLLAACRSNASLMNRVLDLERMLVAPIVGG